MVPPTPTEAPPIRCLILDFDGTFTDVEREAAPFLEAYREGLAELVGEPIDEAWEAGVAEVEAHPDAHGFEHDGRIVAPSHADPYILASSVARLVMSGRGSLTDETLTALFRASYSRSDTVFRPDAKAVLEALLELDVPLFVVSNSDTDQVRRKLERLAPRGLDQARVRGNARKFHLVPPDPGDARFDAVPESLAVDGLERPLYLRRGRYFEALREIWDESGTTPEHTFVCGDIFELDLALPAALGAATHLVTRPNTPPWERAAASRGRGGCSEALSGALERIRARSRRG